MATGVSIPNSRDWCDITHSGELHEVFETALEGP
jgi:hypothetical protein